MYNLNYTPKTLVVQSWRGIISGVTRTKTFDCHCISKYMYGLMAELWVNVAENLSHPIFYTIAQSSTHSPVYKVKLFLCHVQRWGSGGIAPRVLILVTKWMWLVSFTPQQNFPGYLLGGSPSRSGRCGEEKIPFVATGNRTTIPRSRSL
jgi:hypothetical protein